MFAFLYIANHICSQGEKVKEISQKTRAKDLSDFFFICLSLTLTFILVIFLIKTVMSFQVSRLSYWMKDANLLLPTMNNKRKNQTKPPFLVFFFFFSFNQQKKSSNLIRYSHLWPNITFSHFALVCYYLFFWFWFRIHIT